MSEQETSQDSYQIVSAMVLTPSNLSGDLGLPSVSFSIAELSGPYKPQWELISPKMTLSAATCPLAPRGSPECIKKTAPEGAVVMLINWLKANPAAQVALALVRASRNPRLRMSRSIGE